MTWNSTAWAPSLQQCTCFCEDLSYLHIGVSQASQTTKSSCRAAIQTLWTGKHIDWETTSLANAQGTGCWKNFWWKIWLCNKALPKERKSKTGLKNSWWKILSYLNQSTFAGMFPSVDFTKIVYPFLFDTAETFHFEKFRAFSFTASDTVFYRRVSQNWQAGSCPKTATHCPFLCFLGTINLNTASLAELCLSYPHKAFFHKFHPTYQSKSYS